MVAVVSVLLLLACAGGGGPFSRRSSPLPPSGLLALESGSTHSCAVLDGGDVYCWGNNQHAQAGSRVQRHEVGHDHGTLDVSVRRLNPSPAKVKKVVASWVAPGDRRTCAGAAGQPLMCWGDDDQDATPRRSARSAQAAALASGVACALQDGELGCWQGPPVPAPSDQLGSDLVGLSAGQGSVCALADNQRVYCWGADNLGQSAGGGWVAGVDDAVAVDLGYRFACALHATGTVSCWGDNSMGNLGQGSTDRRAHSVPVMVPGIVDASALAVGGDAACVLRRGGTVSCWGAIGWRQDSLGLLDTNTLRPQQVPGISKAELLSVGAFFGCAGPRSGPVQCWGFNFAGQLGDGSIEARTGVVTVLW